ncbi:MAG: hypothetical protein CSB48_01880 [Proteobacteria bacterium]|nr:MAG: hypothetical protein CSB48_01880 [Pseudomonadota bacterium]PIE40388.1 MAG: hypothetical protein CSA51_00910 [Gammaproteobacteria bacterium]
MNSRHSRCFAWFFLYLITGGFIAAYLYGVYQLQLGLRTNAMEIMVVSNEYLLLLPVFLPVLHGVYLVEHWKKPKQRGMSRLSLLAGSAIFATILFMGYRFEAETRSALIANGYSECLNEARQGLRASQHIYKRDYSLCQ